MSKRKEKISAFLDNDMHHDELMSFSLSAEAKDAEAVQRYQMIGDALRGELSNASFVDVSHAVREALADENFAEASALQTKAAPANDKWSLLSLTSLDVSAWFKPAAGLAVATTVAVVIVMSLSVQESSTLSPNGSPVATSVESQPLVQETLAQKAVVATGDNKQLNEQHAVTDEKATEMNPYINQHLEYATQDTLQGRLPYVRAVSFEAEK